MTFTPNYTPSRMLKLGVFGGSYFRDATKADFLGMSILTTGLARVNVGSLSPSRNLYRVKAGLPYKDWMDNGWIFDEDPLGWFHWYCRYSHGRQHERDGHQINRWLKYRQRWGDRYRDKPSAVIKQGLLQWAINCEKL